MPLKSAPGKFKQKSVIYLTFFLLLSIPLVLYGIAKENFDLRKRAFEDLQLSDEYQCLISFPNVNPYSLQEGSTVTVQVDARIKDDYARELRIHNTQGQIIYSEVFDSSKTEFETSFAYSPETSGKADMTGTVTKGQGSLVECKITSPLNIHGLQVVPENSAPEFLSKPSESLPSQNIQTGDMYEYTLTAKDIDGDNINYSYSFTPRADWLKPTVIEDGAGGNLTVKFKGSTNKAASYLAHVLIHDGYSKNVRSQSWVINVSPKENDIPIVTIIEPIESLRIDKGTAFKTSWESVDLNHIVGHELYVTNNPTDEDLWIEIDKEIPYNQNNYSIDTSDLRPGTYKVIVKSTDNQEPPASGIGISPEIVISSIEETDDKKRDDDVLLAQPQIVNVSPSSTDEVTDKLVTIRATLISSEETTIDDYSILFKLNDKDLSEEIRINKISKEQYTIIYHPERELDFGVNKVQLSFKDKEGQEASRTWSFVIKSDKDVSEDSFLIFGYEIPRNVVIIVGIGLITVILALIIPFIIFTIWKGDKRKDDREPYQNDKLPPSTPKDTTQYVEISTQEPEYLKDKVKTKEETHTTDEEKKDVWDMYSAPKPENLKEESEEISESQPTKIVQEQPTPTLPSQEPLQTTESEIPESEISEPQSTKVVQEQPTPTLPPQEPLQTTEPEIPEPEIPDAQQLENIFSQIQQQKTEEETQQTEVVNQQGT